MNTLLELENICVTNRSKVRLKNINFSVEHGEKVAVLGKSGAGKSTMMSVANGTLIPTSGCVKFLGIEIIKLTRKQVNLIGTLWQDLRLIEELSVGQNVNAGALGRHNIVWALLNLLDLVNQDSCKECLKASGLPLELINTPINKLSGGQQQRVAIARLVRQGARLILADEPLSNLDPTLVSETLMLILNQKVIHSINTPSTCIVSIHRPELINYFSRVIGLKEGEILFDLPSNTIKKSELDHLYR